MTRTTIFACVLLAGCDQSATLDQPSATLDQPRDDLVLPRQMRVVAPADTKPRPPEFTGEVVKIIDGNTIDVLTDEKETTRIRLNGIACPERDQPFGNNAAEFVSYKASGKPVRIVPNELDKYGRTIADVYLLGDKGTMEHWLNYDLVYAGLAWHDKRSSDNERLAEEERRARLRKRGLWAGSHEPIPPWDWQQMSKEERDKYP